VAEINTFKWAYDRGKTALDETRHALRRLMFKSISFAGAVQVEERTAWKMTLP
jgi:hypothetical protein